MSVDVSGWQPAWLPAAKQVDKQSAALRNLVGSTITDAWVVWNLEHDEWFADLPVVLSFDGGGQIEVCWQKFDDLSVTWDTIDTTLRPRAWVEWPLEWCRAAHPALASNVGSSVRAVAMTEHLFQTERENQSGPASRVWLVGGLWFGTTGPGLHVFNALDENGLDAGTPPDGYGHRLTALTQSDT